MVRFVFTVSVWLVVIAISLVHTSVGAATPAERLLNQPDSWFAGDEGRKAVECILTWQSQHGDWPKNKDTTKKQFDGDSSKLKGTFDNGATTGELRVLAKAFRVTGDSRYQQAFFKGFDHILRAQYPNGGWPQYFPLSDKYHRHITFNDGSMIRILEFLRDTSASTDFALLDENRHALAHHAFDRGVDCIVKCQVVIDGAPTVWCAQHDEVTLAPADARSYELASLSGAESAGIVRFLMTLDNPSPDVVRAVKGAVAWFESSRIDGYRYNRSSNETNLIKDPNARPLWARFYELKSNRPFFCDRDGVVKYDIQEIGAERRGGYTWYGNWGQTVLNEYAKWLKR